MKKGEALAASPFAFSRPAHGHFSERGEGFQQGLIDAIFSYGKTVIIFESL